MATYLITGGARGLGLALTKHLVALPASQVSKVIVSVRKPSTDLDLVAKSSSGRVNVVQFDVANESSIQKALPAVEAALGGKGLDVLINNAGIAQYAENGTKSMDTLLESLQVNVLGIHWVTRTFLPLLEKGQLKKVANISTTLGSIAFAPTFTWASCPAYKISKAALNSLTVQYSLDHAKDGFTFVAISPGWLKTELGGGDMADLLPEQGAKGTLEIIGRPNSETNGKFVKVFVEGWDNADRLHVYDGKEAPW
ncbi:NAD(P)-binding protein [Dissoconium aciculare CBS 342.82]|uniref:NAD(P)-binding protein n=1 Tax=Dissoconium aciculare CBS 342.82 TaxID=1314786 RepID=A0A6J3M3Y0_9PEZI|nr:NAD(P)-binding protein [Dissoconium aciculare CBS 342.82]KAF1822725.1 NAD(P)-binding protein [Dissoconium aciculare CBS 342.82]